jgi:RND family efflux transporter MFP subunit
MEETLTAYGTVIASPGTTITFSVPFECVVKKEMVTEGQAVVAGAPLLEIEPSPGARLELEKAMTELDAARTQMKLIEERVKMKLATRQALVSARRRVDLIEKRVESMVRRGVDGAKVVCASSEGIVHRIDVRQGQILPPGTTLVEMVSRDNIVVRLGIEPEDITRLRKGQPVDIRPVNIPSFRPVRGRIRLITEQVNQKTRLVDVLVDPKTSDGLFINSYVEGRIVVAAHDALVAPRSAVLPDGGEYSLFTVASGRAVRHAVRIGLENGHEVEVIADGLAAGDPVVIAGNYELEDGMAVREAGRR